MVESVFTFSSSSHALPQTGSTPPPLLCVKSPATPLHQCVCVCLHLIWTRHLDCKRASPWYFTAALVYMTLACPGVCMCVGVFCMCFICSLLNVGPLVPQSGSHTCWLCLLTVCLARLPVRPPWDGWTDEAPLCHRQEWSKHVLSFLKWLSKKSCVCTHLSLRSQIIWVCVCVRETRDICVYVSLSVDVRVSVWSPVEATLLYVCCSHSCFYTFAFF